MKPNLNVPLAQFTSLKAGGNAEQLYICDTTDDIKNTLAITPITPWIVGYGCNVLVSDAGLPGPTALVRSNGIECEENIVIADAGTWWDDLVQYSIYANLWGLELMSGVPGSVGAAVVGNIAAYGQAVADTLAWVEVCDTANREIRTLSVNELQFEYRFSAFQTDDYKDLVILRAAFTLKAEPDRAVTYQSALDVAGELSANLDTLDGRRQTILQTRNRAGSLWDWHHPDDYLHTAGSFFRNPLVTDGVAERIMQFDETGKSAELLKKMNLVHGGDQKRVSAAHVLLAAGFTRGQAWGPVRLHPSHILKIENMGDATAQQIYNVSQEIVGTVKDKLDVELSPEVRFVGEFN